MIITMEQSRQMRIKQINSITEIVLHGDGMSVHGLANKMNHTETNG